MRQAIAAPRHGSLVSLSLAAAGIWPVRCSVCCILLLFPTLLILASAAVVYLMLANQLIREINPEAITIAEDVSGGRGQQQQPPILR